MENITPREMEIRQTGLRTYQVEVFMLADM